MIVEREKIDIVSSGVQVTNSFNISCSVEMFDMLSSGLYKDKIKAVIRELSTNANDAHIEAGVTDKQVKVILPSELEPNFSVRDFGGGMGEDMVMTLYSTYGESTKRMSNAFNGALGVGSKSPFSYSDAFSVVSRHEGMKKTYALYVDNGMPTISKMAEAELTDEDEGTGLEIIVPVLEADFGKFHETATKVYQWFSNRPDVSQDLTYKTLPKLLEGAGWYVYDDTASSYYNTLEGIHVVMANIAYPVDVTNLSSRVKKVLGEAPLLIEVPTGSVRMAASRESLSMTKETIAYLNTHLAKIEAEIVKSIQDKLDTEDDLTAWNKSLLLLNLKDEYNLGELIEENFTEGAGSFKATLPSAVACHVTKYYGAVDRPSFSVTVPVTSKTFFVVQLRNYETAKGSARFKAKRSGGSGTKVVYFTKAVSHTWEEFEKAMVKVMEELGSPDLYPLEDLGCYERVKKERVKRDPADKTPRIKLIDQELRLTPLTTNYYASNIYQKASAIDADPNITKVVVIPANATYFAGPNWDPFTTQGQRGYGDTQKGHRGVSVITDIKEFMSKDTKAFSKWLDQGIVFVVVNKSERTLLKWSSKFVNVHTWIKELQKIPITVPHPDYYEVADTLHISHSFTGERAVRFDKTFRDLAKWFESKVTHQALFNVALRELNYIFPDIKFVPKTLRPKGFNKANLLRRYALWPHIDFAEGKILFLKTVTKTYSEEKKDVN